MWEESTPSDDEQVAEAPPAPEPEIPQPQAEIAWTEGQLQRLENEWRRAQRSFAYHGVVGVIPLRGDPPYEYQIEYRLQTLVMDEGGNLQYVDQVAMHLWLPPGFPHQGPVMRPMVNVFHPNIIPDGVFVSTTWQPTDTLADYIVKVGELLAYRNWDGEYVANPVAWDWLAQNAAVVPTDAQADLSHYAGGEPLGRIMQMGPGTLDQIRQALDSMRSALMGDQDAPTQSEVDDFAKQTRAATSLFLDSDVPDTLRSTASEFDDWCRELPASVRMWDYLRDQRTRAAATESESTALRGAAAAVDSAIKQIMDLVKTDVKRSPATAVKIIPPMPVLEPHQLKLPVLVRAFDQKAAEVRALLAAMKTAPPEVIVAADGSLGRRLAAQEQSTNEAVATATQIGQTALAETDAALRLGKAELRALEQIVGWREYMDMFAKVRAIEKQLAELGAAGIQAFFLENASGRFGPFQYEEPLELGETRVVIRNLQRDQVEVINAGAHDVIGRGTDGSAHVVLDKSAANPAGYPTTFRLTDRCDDLTVQIDFIQKHSGESLKALQKQVTGAKSWCGAVCALLSHERSAQGLREAHRKSSHRWKQVMSDLGYLSRFKERLATWNLIDRMSQEAPRLVESINANQAKVAAATQKIAAIMSRSSRDVATDQLIVPPRLAQAYDEEMKTRDKALHDIESTQALIKRLAQELDERLSSPKYCGRPETPLMRVLPQLPEALAGMQDVMTDDAVLAAINTLEQFMKVQLPFNAPPPPPVRQPVARPTQPTGPATAAMAMESQGIADAGMESEIAVEAAAMSGDSPDEQYAAAGDAHFAVEAEPEHGTAYHEEEAAEPHEEIIEGF